MTVRKVLSSSQKIEFERIVSAQSMGPLQELINESNIPSSVAPKSLKERVSVRPARKQMPKRPRDYDEIVSAPKRARVEQAIPALPAIPVDAIVVEGPTMTTSSSPDSPVRAEEIVEHQTVTLDDRRVYIGPIKDGKFHGQGMMIFPNDLSYEGQFIDGSISGIVIVRYPNGTTYQGELKEWKFHGQGILAYTNGTRYEGRFVDGAAFGQVAIFNKNGKIYEGGFSKGKYEGHGLKNFPDGTKYIGQWVNSQFHGLGILNTVDGYRYEGEFENGSFHGNGKLIFADGRPSLEGRFFNGEFEHPSIQPSIQTHIAPQRSKIKIVFPARTPMMNAKTPQNEVTVLAPNSEDNFVLHTVDGMDEGKL